MEKQLQNLLESLENFQSQGNKRWNVPHETGNFLNLLIKATRTKKVLEIGTSNGYSGIWIAAALKETGGKLITVESHETRFNEASENFKKAGLTNYITQIKGHAPDCVNTNETFDFMFFDAIKSEQPKYFSALKNKLKVGGLIATDNLFSHNEELQEFIQITDQDPAFQNSHVPIGTGVLLSLKVA